MFLLARSTGIRSRFWFFACNARLCGAVVATSNIVGWRFIGAGRWGDAGLFFLAGASSSATCSSCSSGGQVVY